MALQFIGLRIVSSVTVAAAGLLIGCGKSAPPPRQGEVQVTASPLVNRAVVQSAQPAEPIPAKDEPSPMPAPSALRTSSPAKSQAENQLGVALAQYPVADRQARTDIEEHLAGLADQGVNKGDIAKALGSMFVLENSVVIKNSILAELYALGGSSALDQVIIAALPDQPLEVRDEAISILQDFGDKRAIPTLLPLLSDSDENIRGAARDAIHSLYNPPAP